MNLLSNAARSVNEAMASSTRTVHCYQVLGTLYVATK